MPPRWVRNAIISMRFDSSEMGSTMSEIVAYGTAAIVEPESAAAGQALPVIGRPGQRGTRQRRARQCRPGWPEPWG